MDLIQEEILHGGDNIQLAWTPQWLLSPTTMVEVRANREKRTASVKLTHRSQEDKDQIIKYCIWFGGRRHRTGKFVKISTDTLC